MVGYHVTYISIDTVELFINFDEVGISYLFSDCINLYIKYNNKDHSIVEMTIATIVN